MAMIDRIFEDLEVKWRTPRMFILKSYGAGALKYFGKLTRGEVLGQVIAVMGRGTFI